MTVTLRRHPSGAREVAFEGSPRAVGIVVRVNVQDDPGNRAPVSTFIVGVEQTEVGDDVLFVVCSECWSGWGKISDIRIEGRLLHGRSRDESTTRGTQPRPRL